MGSLVLMGTGFLTTETFLERYGDELARVSSDVGLDLDPIRVPADPAERLDEASRNRVELSFFSPDIFPDYSRSFFSTAQGAPNLRWLHIFNAGVDTPVFQRLMQRGVRLSTSAGASAEPIAQSMIGGLLMLARNFPFWLANQRERRWQPMPPDQVPDDLRGQTIVVLGFGAIGRQVGRLAQALGLHVIGIRRRPAEPDDPVDEMLSPAQLLDVLPRAQWLAITAPLTEETRGLVGAEALSRLPHGARVMNVGRGEIVDEPALIAALRSGRIGGAYLDVFHEEPLPPESPLWDMRNVIISPHNSSVSRGNEARSCAIFFENLARWGRGEPLRNEETGDS